MNPYHLKNSPFGDSMPWILSESCGCSHEVWVTVTPEACGHLSTRREWTLGKVKGFLLMDGKGDFFAGKFLKSAGIIGGEFCCFCLTKTGEAKKCW